MEQNGDGGDHHSRCKALSFAFDLEPSEESSLISSDRPFADIQSPKSETQDLMHEATCWPASEVYDCCDIFLSITLTCALPTYQKRKEAKKVRSLVVIKQSAQNNLQTILPCGLKSFGSSLLMSNSYVWLLTESSSETLIQRNDPKKCSGIGIGAPYLTRQCQFSQLLAISTCDCNQPTFTCW